jgi:hypothetical protein
VAVELRTDIDAGLAGLSEVWYRGASIGGRVRDAERVIGTSLERPVVVDCHAQPRAAARWRWTLLVAGLGLLLPFEVGLNGLALQFLDAPDVLQRFLAVGVSVATVLIGVLAPDIEDARAALRSVAVWLLILMVVGLAALRYGAISAQATATEQIGGTLALFAVAAAFALGARQWHRWITTACEQDDRWQKATAELRRLAAHREQLALLTERRDGLAAELTQARDRAIEMVASAPSRFDAMANWWWVGYQSRNRHAAPDVRPQLEALLKELKAQTADAVRRLEERAATIEAVILNRRPSQLPATTAEVPSNV